MNAIQIKSTKDKYIITIQKDALGKAQVLEVLRWMRLKLLLQKAEFESDIEEVGEDILSEWWEKNKSTFIPAEEV